MKKSFRKVQFLSNIAIIVIAVLLCVITVKLFFPTTPPITVSGLPNNFANSNSRPATVPQQTTAIGKTVPMENVDWKNNKKTLILYISTTCRFCDESSPFYKQLVEKYSNSQNVKLIAVLPQKTDEAKAHLKNLGVNINEVYNASFSPISVTATPTLLLVNDSGVITEFWRGKLTSEREAEVLSRLSS